MLQYRFPISFALLALTGLLLVAGKAPAARASA
jgi:hypothetical protein